MKEFATARIKVKPSVKRKVAILAIKSSKTGARITEGQVIENLLK